MSIIVKDIVKKYGAQYALNKVSFSIQPGEIVGFIGPNGAGKSTMMKIITGYLRPDEGEVSVNGFDIISSPIELRKSIGYLPENNPLYLSMYVKEYLAFVAGIHRVNNKATCIQEIIHLAGLEKEQHKRIGQLSKGYRQRVGIAQALIHQPPVLILDEPTTGLDPNQIVEIRTLIKQTGKNKSVILSTHLMQEVEAICDRIIIINNGCVVADDSREKIHHYAGKEMNTIIVEFSTTVDQSSLGSIPGINDIKDLGNNCWLLQCPSDNDIRNDIFQFAVQRSISVLSLQKQQKSLEQVFRELTKQ